MLRDVPDLAYEPIFYEKREWTVRWRPRGIVALHRQGHKKFEFTLRHDARFSDGTLVTAHAVQAWLQYYAKVDPTGVGRIGPAVLKSTVSTNGKWTVVIKLQSPYANLPSELSDYITDYGSVAGPKVLAHPKSLNTTTDGAGPYMLDPSQSVAGSKYVYVPNPYFYR